MIYLPKYVVLLLAILSGIPASAYTPDYYTRSSLLADGLWIRVRVTETGMQEISHAQLQELGFDDPEQVEVYGYGGVRLLSHTFSTNLPDDMFPTASIHTDGKLIFYGESDVRNDVGTTETSFSIRRNAYARGGYYFLSDRVSPDRNPMEVVPYNPASASVRQHHTSVTVHENELECPAQAGTDFFDQDLTKAQNPAIALDVDDPYAPTATVRYEFVAKAEATSMLSFQLPSDVNLSSSYTARAEGVYPSDHNYYNRGAGYHTFTLRSGVDQTYTIVPELRSSAAIEYAAIDNVGLIYRRSNSLAGKSQLRMSFFNTGRNASFRLTEAEAGTQVWNVDDPLDIYAYELHPTGNPGEYDASFRQSPSGTTVCIEAFDPSATLYTPEIIGATPNQDLHALDVPDMLIVTTASMRDYAEEVADLHRTHQGMTVHVVDQQQAFNEFSSGTPHPMGIRRLAKMFYDRDPQRFRYLLLYGGGTYDNRALTVPDLDYLLTFQCESRSEMNSAATSYCADSYFGMLSDKYRHNAIHFEDMSVAVGRIPVLNNGDAANINKKIGAYFENPPAAPVRDRVLLMSDAGDSNSHLKQIEEVADTILRYSPATTLTKAYNSLYPLTGNNTNAKAARNAIVKALTSGVGYMAYCGHGNPNSLSFENYYQKSHVRDYTYRFFPMVMMSTCDLFAFDRTTDDMGSAFIYSPYGGAAAIVAACRSVYQDLNQYLATAMAREISQASPATATGDIFRNAHNAVAAEGRSRNEKDLAINTLCYNLGGDPALPLYAPSYRISIAGIGSGSTAAPLTPIAIEGSVTDSDGNDATWFSGQATISVYGDPRTVSTYPRRGDPSLDVVLDEDLIAETTAEVTGGRFRLTLVLPEPERATTHLRLSAYAISGPEGRHATATGHISGIVFDSDSDPSTTVSDTEAPVIDLMYLDTPDFADGDCIGNTPVLHIHIMPDASGLNVMSSGIGGLHLSMDDTSSLKRLESMLVKAADGSVSLSVPLGTVADGRHTLTLNAVDNAGNTAQRSITFIVRGETYTALTVDEYPARKSATLHLTHTFPETPEGRLIIENADGTTVCSVENPVFPFRWDLCDTDGTRVADGEYSAIVILKSGKFHGNSPRVPIVVVE